MKYLIIENDGLIELDALHLLGASTKRDDELIGKYGSGNKYAIAGLIRNRIGFKIYSGEEEFSISTEKRTFRDKEFNVLHINGKPTSITTELGLDWELWHCLREIISNALDEGGHHIYDADTVIPQTGKTIFAIEMTADVTRFWANRKEYFTMFREEQDVLESTNEVKILKKVSDEGLRVYKKGILVYNKNKMPSAFDYNLDEIEINEMRTIGSFYEARTIIGKYFRTKAKSGTILAFLKTSAVEDSIEYYVNYSSWEKLINIEEWIVAIGNRIIIPKSEEGNPDVFNIPANMRLVVKDSMEEFIYENIPNLNFHLKRVGDIVGEVIEPTPLMLKTVEIATDFLYEIGYNINSEIVFMKSRNPNMMGQADPDNNKITLFDTLFDKGLAEVIRTLLEEWLHVKSGYSDCTREFQNYIFDQFISKMAKAKDIVI